MTWTAEHAADAAAQGWGVFDVWCENQWRAMIMPLKFSSKVPNVQAMTNHVIAVARVSHDGLAVAALREVAARNMQRGKR